MFNIIILIYCFFYLSNKIFDSNINKIKYTINKNIYKNDILYYKYFEKNTLLYDNISFKYEKRIKSKKRILKKISKFKIPYDIYGLRIIYNDSYNYYNKEFAYIIKNILYDNFFILENINDDYIKYPKKNNYQSLHIYIVTNIIIEIQIRNNYMHYISCNGTASRYYD